MPRLSLIPTLFRETFSSPQFARQPEPDLVMDDDEQVREYAAAGRIDGIMSASYLWNSARISSVIAGSQRVLDLGCGPATQLAQVAALNPDVSFVGLDLSSEMLANAATHLQEKGLGNVELAEGDITRLSAFEDQSFDAVISTMAIHHLPTEGHLDQCFAEINRVLKPGGAVYLIDFNLLKSLKSILFFAYLNARFQPEIFSLDYERSLRAAFTTTQFQSLAARHLPQDVTGHATFGIPVLQLLKTPDRELPASTREAIAALRDAMPRKYRKELDDQRFFFRLSGVKNDPF